MNAPLRHDPDLGFCRFRIPLHGRRAIWEVTNACNYGCRYCIFGSTSRVPPGELGTDRALSVVSELAAAGFTHVKFTGGEPFLRPDMVEILERARALGIACDVSTNASRIEAGTAARLAALGLDMVHVSLDGPDLPSHEAVRGRDTFAPSLEGLRLLVGAGVPVRVGCVVHARNEDLIPAMAGFCADLGAGSVVFSRMEPVGRMRGRPTLVTALDDAAIRGRVAQALRLHGGRIAITHNLDAPASAGCGTCPGGDRFAFIDHRGRISPCTWVSEHRPDLLPEGSLAGSSAVDLLADPAIAWFRKAVAAFAATGARACPMSERVAFAKASETAPRDPGRFGPEAPIYGFATEGLGYVPDIVRPGDRTLVVTGSGDHAIMAALSGAAEVACVDVNRLATLWARIKLAALALLDREAFLDFLLPGKAALSPLVAKRLCIDLPQEAADFLRMLAKAGPTARSGPLFVGAHAGREAALRNAPYLRSATSYMEARNAVSRTRLTFLTQDIRELTASEGPANLDAILLSNLAEHGHRLFPDDPLDGFRDAVVRPLADRLAPSGRLALYAFDGPDLRGSGARTPFGDPAQRRPAYAGIPGMAAWETALPSALDDAGPGDADALLVLTRHPDA